MKYIFTEGYQYVGIDNASGGYPYITDNCMDSKVWYSIEEAVKYAKMFRPSSDRWQLRKLNGLDMSLPIGEL